MTETSGTKTRVILVLSGKGGVGKSTVSTSLALGLALGGARVGILDVDLTGPSVPRMLGVSERRVHQGSRGWVPVRVPLPILTQSQSRPASNSSTQPHHELACMSIGFLLKDKGDAVIWRGPKKTAMIRQFLQDVDWGQDELDYLVVDTPPGTGDEHIALVESLREGWRVDGAVLVTTPQQIAVADVRKELSFCNKVGIRVLGVVENMSGYMKDEIESENGAKKGGGEALASEHNLPFLGCIPIDPSLVTMIESSVPVPAAAPSVEVSPELTVGGYVAGFAESGLYTVFQSVISKIIANLPQNTTVSHQ
ncbi:cytosolic Fe-S cluster assembly factor cfd1 [Physocladia obscura]|uniref:Cytosolic Fe-S cluster assembly factor cfd1 n=1 Tax=Physocladia obscura TaxID=109957 RepID=A0AAD5SRV4_9FUNG|nr:cytosolic Fe-S cluster assembly factor cfd1 [Physocladia obscura]